MEEQEKNAQGYTLPPKITKENINPHAGSKRGIFFDWLKAILATIISSLLIAIAAYSLITPNDFTIGGASGIAILLNVISKGKIPQGAVLFAINFPLIILAFIFVKKRFAILSSMNILLQSLWLTLIEWRFPDFKIAFGVGGEKIFAALAAGLCIGVAIALAFKVGGSTGGADILAVMIQKKFKATSIAWTIFVINCIIICSSVFVFYEKTDEGKLNYAVTLLPIMMSAFESFIESKTNESLANGFQSATEFRIITDKPEEMANAIMHELRRGVTSMPATGMYTKTQHAMLVCVISRRQAATLRRIMQEVDPDSFAVTTKVSQVLGLGFYSDGTNS